MWSRRERIWPCSSDHQCLYPKQETCHLANNTSKLITFIQPMREQALSYPLSNSLQSPPNNSPVATQKHFQILCFKHRDHIGTAKQHQPWQPHSKQLLRLCSPPRWARRQGPAFSSGPPRMSPRPLAWNHLPLLGSLALCSLISRTLLTSVLMPLRLLALLLLLLPSSSRYAA